jgi:tRNA(Ile)-lysidine synthase
VLLRALSETIREQGLAGRKVHVACSGGVDSTVLLHALDRLAPRHGLALSLGHVHHGLRGAEADADLAAVERLADKHGVPFAATRLAPGSLAAPGAPSRMRPTVQEAARTARYHALREQAERLGAERIATAHHRDDQAETVLLRLFRGAGADALGGIPERSADGWIVRPLLGVGRSEIVAYARAMGLAWREDGSNASRSYARNRLRHDWMPGLEAAFNPRLSRALADLAEAARRDAEWIARAVEEECRRWTRREDESTWIAAEPWPALPEALARRMVRTLLREQGGGRDVTRRHLLRALTFLRSARPGTGIELPGNLRLVRTSEGFRLGPEMGSPPGSC